MVTPSVPATPAGRCGDARVSHNGDQRCRDASFRNARTRWGDGTPTYWDILSLIVGNAPLITRYHFGVDFPPLALVTARVSSQRSRAVLVTPSVPTTPVGRCGDDRASRNGGQRCRNASFWDAGTPLGGRRRDILASDSINPSPNVTTFGKALTPVTVRVSPQRPWAVVRTL